MGPLLALGGATLFLGARYLVKRNTDAALAELRNTPSPAPVIVHPPQGPAPPAPQQTGPVRLSDPFPAVPGGRYVASVTVNGLLALAASTSSVASEARKMGFLDAVATKNKPVGIPLANGDYYVTATFSSAPKAFPRSNVGGKVLVNDVWRIG